jgi:NADP-dependent aldehyde dehydrogenase
MLVPIGPVAIFGSSNFPFAFSVVGGDTAAALAAGCPALVKAHELHPETSKLSYGCLRWAIDEVGCEAGWAGLIYGREAGRQLVACDRVSAVAFTGSVRGAQALIDVINERESPIPFYGELSSVNPVVATERAVESNGPRIGTALAESVMARAGQMCTKPGIVFVPDGNAGDGVVASMRREFAASAPRPALSGGIAQSYRAEVDALARMNGVTSATRGGPAANDIDLQAELFTVNAGELTAGMCTERFGPTTLIVRYRDHAELLSAIGRLPQSLTATVHGVAEADNPTEHERLLIEALSSRAGRLVFDGVPTGVAVTWAMNHGGGWPSTNSTHTSVGPYSIRRFLRRRAWQGAPQWALPAELRDDAPGLPRRVDGAITVADGRAALEAANSAASQPTDGATKAATRSGQ